MDSAARVMCQNDPFNPLVTSSYQVSWILVVSHFFHLVLKPLGQPGPVAQILAGLVLGPSLLCRIREVGKFFIQPSSADYYRAFAFFSRIFFTFLIGLEFDISYLKRNFRAASTIAYGGFVVNAVLGAIVTSVVVRLLNITFKRLTFVTIGIIMFANSASPVVIRLASELKMDSSDVGRLAVSSSLINEMSGSLYFCLFLAFSERVIFGIGVLTIVLTIVLIIVNKYLAIWFNRKNHNRKYITNSEVLVILVLILVLSMIIEYNGLYSTIPCFLVGMMFPREGKTTRTLLRKLTYAVHDFILPIYFGFTGFQFDINVLATLKHALSVSLMLFISIAGKVLGTVVACRYMNIPGHESAILGFMLSLKGHGELVIVDAAPGSGTWWGQEMRSLLLTVIVLNTMIAGPVVTFLLKRQEAKFAHNRTSLESLDPESDLQIISCVYGTRNAYGQLGLFSAFHGTKSAAVTPYLMHLVELPKKRKKKALMYHQLEDGDHFSDEEEYGGNDVIEINDAIDSFTAESKLVIRQIKVVSSFRKIYEDVCTRAEDLRASIIFIPFHKHQRIDGKMESAKDEIRAANQKIIRHAPCSIGILVDRGCLRFQKLLAPDTLQNVATLFFGGPDDREALACSKRIAMHPRLNLTVIRFVAAPTNAQNLTTSSSVGDEFFMSIAKTDAENEKDNAYVWDFHERYVSSGKIGYVEKQVSDGAETLAALRDIGDMYSLFIVGKGGRGHTTLTTGMSDWEECPELGAVGDLLASMDFDINASVLVIQQHRHSNESLNDDD